MCDQQSVSSLTVIEYSSDLQRLRSACAYALEYFMTVKLLTEHNLELLSLKGGCRGSSESTLVKISNCWKSHHCLFNHFFFLKIPLNLNVKDDISLFRKAFTSLTAIRLYFHCFSFLLVFLLMMDSSKILNDRIYQ